MALEHDIVTELVAGLVGTANVNIFISTRSNVPVDAGPYLSVVATGGAGPIKTHNELTKPAYRRPGAQVSAIGSSYTATEAMVQKAYDVLSAVRNKVIGTTFYLDITPQQEPFDMGIESGRVRVGFNVLAERRT